MTLLLIDIGNTNLKWGQQTEQGFVYGGSCSAQSKAIQQLFQQELASIKPQAIFISSVASDEIRTNVERLCDSNWELSPQFLKTPAEGCGISNAYPVPESMGSDRWAAMVAACHLVDGAVCLVSCGTAVTLDIVRADGQHLGGLIAPGYELMQASLQQGTHIRMADAEATSGAALGQSTDSCIQGGIASAISAMVQSMFRRYQQDIAGLQLVLTGGGADRLARDLELPARNEPHLVLQGLGMIYQSERAANPV